MFKGMGTSLVGIAPFIGIKMSSYDVLMDSFGNNINDRNRIYYNLLMGALAGTVAVTLTYPIDLIRKLLQLNGTPGHNYSGVLDAWSKV